MFFRENRQRVRWLTKIEKYARTKAEAGSFKMIEMRKAKREICLVFHFSLRSPRFEADFGGIKEWVKRKLGELSFRKERK